MSIGKGLDYKKSGVDIQKADRMIDFLKPDIEATKSAAVISDIGGFAGMFDLKQLNYKHPVLVSATDGVGTKLLLALNRQQYNGIGDDLVAMCVNDIIVSSAKPIFFLDYLSCGTLNTTIATSVIKSIAHACKAINCSLLGGETAEMPGLYQKDEIDLAGFAVGVAEKDSITSSRHVKNHDRVIAIKSSGPHANGYSLIRSCINKQLQSGDRDSIPYAELLTPTIIYENQLRPLFAKSLIHSLAHITGGGITNNLPRAMPAGATATLNRNWKLPTVFEWIKQSGNLSQQEMDLVFNQGVGMILITDEDKRREVLRHLNENDSNNAWDMGSITTSNSNHAPRVEWQ